ncbi:unnamed protein product [Vitrella brassicaformis CCMP3155]|uniref:Ion transport domain-containing protein n=1 Tax=Vitrella brassicaformis (strain CCMP3155) TaxID=1169540 RepID=A0A0G4EFK6_VITBC|nr:unnamed protein product [Vitrella brassicaformis CCMP3155]|eukprot:CEL94838.1 unnamed protein product [Vitrella brassicaformis CCMP3155]
MKVSQSQLDSGTLPLLSDQGDREEVDVGVHGSAGGKEAGTGSPVTAPRTPSGSATVSPSERIVAAARQGDSTMLRTYLTSFSPEETLDKDKCNALHLLAKAGLLEPILPLLSECPIWREALSHRNTDQNTPLHMCNFNLISLKLISAARSDALQVSNKDGNILLHMSVLANTLSVSDRIIDVGGLEQLDIKNKVSVTSQHTRSLPFLGPLILATIKMLQSDISKFIVIYLFILMSFAAAFMSLSYDHDHFGTFERAILTLFYAGLGDFKDPLDNALENDLH